MAKPVKPKGPNVSPKFVNKFQNAGKPYKGFKGK